jgi:hypothetical protein
VAEERTKEEERSIARIQEIPTAVSALELQKILTNARAEIAAHQKWQNEVLASLSVHQDRHDACPPAGRSYAGRGKMVEGADRSFQPGKRRLILASRSIRGLCDGYLSNHRS